MLEIYRKLVMMYISLLVITNDRLVTLDSSIQTIQLFAHDIKGSLFVENPV